MTGTPARVLLAVTGSFAAWAAPGIVFALRHAWGAEVHVAVSAAATTFVTRASLEVASGHRVHPPATDGPTTGVSHLSEADWADLVLVAPASANTIAHIAHGLASTALTTLVFAAASPVVVAPSMNERMWIKPVVQRNVERLVADGIGVVPPTEGYAAHDLKRGAGAMASVPAILSWVEAWLRDPAASASMNGAQR